MKSKKLVYEIELIKKEKDNSETIWIYPDLIDYFRKKAKENGAVILKTELVLADIV